MTTQHAAQFVSAVLPTIRRVAQGWASIRWVCWRRRLWKPAGEAHGAHGGRQPEPQFVRHQGGREWSGARAVADTVEFNGGVATQRRTAFRAYGSIEESVNDFANLLSNSPRYRDAVAAGGNAQAYIHSIARSGYATDPEYGNKLNHILNSDTLRAALGANA